MPEVCSLAVEILEGLVHLHAAGIWHLDLKPANVLLDEHRHAFLSDFGASYALQTLRAAQPQAAGLAPHTTCETFQDLE